MSYNELDPDELVPMPILENWLDHARRTEDFSADATTVPPQS
ncbi:MAG TPA: hypothetical protein PKM36_01755 [Propionibacteriaceae bacterium]|nr:hypothetical protein [Propionibacteriaceae bacterium]HPZ48477.1 hypothetical protein [Propionibacteriaceae bacterium]HQE31065.1 hypothetical protein [Propionibacteriaceae bacterium]